MAEMQTLLAFLGWCTLINLGLLIFAAAWLKLFRGFTVRVHTAMFNLEEPALDVLYMQYLAHYKILIIVFNLVPYLALRIIA